MLSDVGLSDVRGFDPAAQIGDVELQQRRLELERLARSGPGGLVCAAKYGMVPSLFFLGNPHRLRSSVTGRGLFFLARE